MPATTTTTTPSVTKIRCLPFCHPVARAWNSLVGQGIAACGCVTVSLSPIIDCHARRVRHGVLMPGQSPPATTCEGGVLGWDQRCQRARYRSDYSPVDLGMDKPGPSFAPRRRLAPARFERAIYRLGNMRSNPNSEGYVSNTMLVPLIFSRGCP